MGTTIGTTFPPRNGTLREEANIRRISAEGLHGDGASGALVDGWVPRRLGRVFLLLPHDE